MKQRDYTMACAEQLRRQGYADADVKTDETVTASDPDGCLVCFRCIPAGWGRVGEMEVEELIPLIGYYGADRGAILTSGRFTLGARLRAKQEGNVALISRFRPAADRTDDFEAVL